MLRDGKSLASLRARSYSCPPILMKSEVVKRNVYEVCSFRALPSPVIESALCIRGDGGFIVTNHFKRVELLLDLLCEHGREDGDEENGSWKEDFKLQTEVA
jgi:hypothetical protein